MSAAFTVPFSSSPPSTPDSRRHRVRSHDNSFAGMPHPSTTPAGPPPTSTNSFTPAGPPPSMLFDSSQIEPLNTSSNAKRNINTDDNLSSDPGQSRKLISSHFVKPKVSNLKGGRSNSPFAVPGNSPQSQLNSEAEDRAETQGDAAGMDVYNSDEYEEHGTEDSEDAMDAESDTEQKETDGTLHDYLQSQNLQSSGGFDWAQSGSSLRDPTPRGMGSIMENTNATQTGPRQDRTQRARRNESMIPTIAKDLAKQIKQSSLDEPDDLILETEELVGQIYSGEDRSEDQELVTQAALIAVPEALAKLWQSCCNRTRDSSTKGEFTIGIGPSEHESPLQKATFLSTLALHLHHPPATKGKQAFVSSKSRRISSFSNPLSAPPKPKSVPEVLLDWLENHHNPYRTAINDIMSCYPNPTAHLNFWDIIFSSTLRGKIGDVLRILRESDFTKARTAREDGQDEDGYRGLQLGSVTRVINRAIQTLESCPGYQDDDWDIPGNDWIIFRKRVEHAIMDLATFAEGRDRDLDPADSTFEAENFGLRSTARSLSRSARRAESRVPWTIYQNLKAMYGVLLGGTTEVLAFAQDWVEATIGLTVWWDGDDDDEIALGSLAVSRRSFVRSQSRIPRYVDTNTGVAYQRRLAHAFDRITDNSHEDAFQINSISPVEVGLASIFEGNIEGFLGILQRWSFPITAAVTEIASEGGWFSPFPREQVTNGFDESDLMVLSYGQIETGLTRDGILIEYAQMLCSRDILTDARTDGAKEGWEFSIQILTRLEDTKLANKQVGDILRRLPLSSDQRVDKLLNICSIFSLSREAASIAERYADSVADNSDKYGTALVYYARAHNAKKVKFVLDLLISLSLVESAAYPELSGLDPNLKALVFTRKESLTQLSLLDPDAAELLQFYLSGYATLRKFYDLRDQEVNLSEGQKPCLRPIARKKAAASALLAVIASAADNIHGGLYDESRNAIVQVDGLLALLGEVMVFIDQPRRTLSFPQLLCLLKAIEDLETVTSHVYAECEDCFQSMLAAMHSSHQLPPPKDLLKKSISSLTSSSAFSLVGSSILNGGSSNGNGGSEASGKGKPREGGVKRGWDWRTGLTSGASGRGVLRILRLKLAKEVARAWIDGDNV